MKKGTVKWFSVDKGFGIISPTENGDDLIFYIKDNINLNATDIHEGLTVIFDVVNGIKGDTAVNVQVE